MANRIKELRERAGMNKAQLARAIGATRQHFGRLESGERPLSQDWLIKLATALSCRPGDIVDDTDPLTPEELALLMLYRKSDEKARRAARAVLDAFSEPASIAPASKP